MKCLRKIRKVFIMLVYQRKISTKHFWGSSTKVHFPTMHHRDLKPAESLSILYLRVSAQVFLMLRNLLASYSLVGLKHNDVEAGLVLLHITSKINFSHQHKNLLM